MNVPYKIAMKCSGIGKVGFSESVRLVLVSSSEKLKVKVKNLLCFYCYLGEINMSTEFASLANC